ncbi:hypothetical protein LMG26411_05317 [Cupriavidus numazuensis]|uniref:DUF1254 domain-containing protein n=2 Tax=Cupriavidus numazuensis TaxID=221992 RepID=A0ABM8TNZ1_9BURK|nr:hypothetical protein LMG26411_05317 [Cupriavidus numazuensis]
MTSRRDLLTMLAAFPGAMSAIALPTLTASGTAYASDDSPTAAPALPTGMQGDWREQYAYSLGIQAYVFGFPYVLLPALRWKWTSGPKPATSMTPYAPLNSFYHARRLTDATYRDGGTPNNDTLYSIAWVDVSREPVILSHPEMGARYFAFEIASLDSDNFAYVSQRATGPSAGSFAIVGPNWKGTLPRGVKQLPPSRTNSVLILGRTLVRGPDDLPTVVALQDHFRLNPLSLWGHRGLAAPPRRDVWQPFDPRTDPLADWKTMNRAMTEDPPEGRLDKLLGQFATIGIGPGQDVDKMDSATRAGLARAAVGGRALLREAVKSPRFGRQVNYWSIPPGTFGRAGLADDFLLRGAVQCLGGIIANDPAEAVYMSVHFDGVGRPLDGARKYVLRFAPGKLPSVDAFWSLSLYDPTHNFTPNAIDRYALGDRSAGLTRDADGSLTIFIQNERPDEAKVSNWLPSTKSGPFSMVLRAYRPGPEIVQQIWAPPPVQQVG